MKITVPGVWASQLANIFELLGIALVLFMTLAFQFFLHELPCPLCLLQRIGFLGIAFGFLLNMKFGFRPSHYSIILLSALFAGFVALRQISLHVLPDTGAYGSAILGLHLYTWSFIVAMFIVLTTTLLLGIDRQYLVPIHHHKFWIHCTRIFFVVMIFTILVNIISVALECGMHMCPDNPISYVAVMMK